MPGFDGTGPLGQGAMTGRGMGNCNPAWNTYQAGSVYGYGRGRGRGLGRGCGPGRGMGFGWGAGFGRGFFPGRAVGVSRAGVNPEMEKLYLQEQAAYLKEEMDLIKNELANIEEMLNKEN